MNEAPKNQFEFIRKFNDNHREQFNDDLFVRDTDEIIEELKKAILSCQRSKYYTIRVDGFTVVEDYPTMIKLLHDQEAIKSDNKDKSFNKYDYINLKDTEMKLLIVNYFIAVPNPKSDAPKSKNLKVLIMVPKFVDKYYLKIFGTWYCPKLQIVDGSTYNNSQNPNSKNPNVAFKSMFMASRFYRYSTELKTTSGEVIKAVYYASSIFSKMVPGVKYILARYGLAGALHKFMIPDLILTSEDPKDENYYTVKKHNVFVSLPKFIFDNDVVAQSLMATIVSSINSKDYTADTVRTKEFWLMSLGESYDNKSSAKGESVLESLETIYDRNARDSIRLPEEYKKDIYDILVWILREYANLRLKNNLDVGTKRKRLAEYFAALYITKLSTGMFKFADEGKNIQISQIEKRIFTFPDYLLKVISRDRLVNSRDNVNDDDAFLALKFSYKGISGLGENKNSSIPRGYRQVHPSHLGRIDLDSSSPNDPGLTGMICPMAEMHDNYFSDYNEPNTWRSEIRQMLNDYNHNVLGLKKAIEFQHELGVYAPDLDDKEKLLDEQIEATESMVIPFIMGVDASMIDCSPIKPFSIDWDFVNSL